MANNAKGLGKGLAALLGDNVMESGQGKSSLYLPISQVESCAAQPRKQFDPDALADLADLATMPPSPSIPVARLWQKPSSRSCARSATAYA